MPLYLSLWPLALRRLLTRWRLMLPLLVGAVLAVALISSVVIYGDAVRRLGLEHSLKQLSGSGLDVHLLAYNAPVDPRSYAKIHEQVESSIERNLHWFRKSSVRGIKGATLFVNDIVDAGAGSPVVDAQALAAREAVRAKAEPRLRSVLFFQEELAGHVKLQPGGAPLPDETGGAGKEVPAWIMAETARAHDLQVGDRVVLTPFWESVSPYLTARVAGIIQPVDPRHAFWSTRMQRDIQDLHGQNYIPFYVSEKTFQQTVAKHFPEMLTDYAWTVFVDTAKIGPDNASLAAFGLDRIARQLRTQLGVGYIQDTALDQALKEFGVKDVFGRVPLLIVTTMIAGIIIYYLIMVASVAVRHQAAEMTLLRSRGADPPQLLALYAWEAVFLSTLAFAAGPFVAWGATSLLGYTPIFSGLTEGGALPARITPEVFAAAWVASVLTLGALLAPMLRGGEREAARARAASARPVSQSIFLRYYLDVFAAVIAGVLFWELTQRGSVVTTTLLDSSSVDQALLAAPALILAAVALLFLRIFPYAVQALAWLANKSGQVWIVLGLWQAGRNPQPYALPVLLLMLASSIAMFAANFGSTVNRGYADRAAYTAGSAVRMQTGEREAQSLIAAAANIPSSPVFRNRASLPLQIFNTADLGFLAVDPATFRNVAWYREDFSEAALGSLMDRLAADTPKGLHGIPIADQANALSLWAMPAQRHRGMFLSARVADARGRYFDIPLGALGAPAWTRFTVPLPLRQGGRPLVRPLRIVALHLVHGQGSGEEPGAIHLETLEALGPGGAPLQTLVDFRQPGSATVIRDTAASTGDALEASTSGNRAGEAASAVFLWGPGAPLAPRGLAFATTAGLQTPMTGIISRSMAEGQRLRVGDDIVLSVDGHNVPVRVADVVDFFPTMDPYTAGFVVVDLSALMERLNTVAPLEAEQPNEVWFAPTAAQKSALLRAAPVSGKTFDRDALLDSYRADPLIAAGWNGVLSMAFLAVLFATLMGFTVYSLVQGQSRRVEFALLRSLGLSFWTLAGVVLVEQILVIVTGMALGTWLGIKLTTLIMPFLGLTEGGSRVVPPFAVAIDWRTVSVVYGIMAASFVLTTIALIGVFSRTAIQRALRFGEV